MVTVFNTKAGVTDKPWRRTSSDGSDGSGISRGSGVLVEVVVMVY